VAEQSRRVSRIFQKAPHFSKKKTERKGVDGALPQNTWKVKKRQGAEKKVGLIRS